MQLKQLLALLQLCSGCRNWVMKLEPCTACRILLCLSLWTSLQGDSLFEFEDTFFWVPQACAPWAREKFSFKSCTCYSSRSAFVIHVSRCWAPRSLMCPAAKALRILVSHLCIMISKAPEQYLQSSQTSKASWEVLTYDPTLFQQIYVQIPSDSYIKKWCIFWQSQIPLLTVVLHGLILNCCLWMANCLSQSIKVNQGSDFCDFAFGCLFTYVLPSEKYSPCAMGDKKTQNASERLALRRNQ